MCSAAPSMSHASFANCRLKQLTDADCKEIIAVPGLTEVNLSGNVLSSLPACFATLVGAFLVQLDLSRNRLTEIPVPVLSLSRLCVLNLRSNLIKKLPARLNECLLELETLNLGENDLLPEALAALGGMKSLELLVLDSNGLPSARLSDLPCLQSLDLRKNHLVSLPELSNVPALVELSLRSNKLSTLASAMFDGIDAVHKLDMGDNMLSESSDLVDWGR